jgi:hypothetical protein
MASDLAKVLMAKAMGNGDDTIAKIQEWITTNAAEFIARPQSKHHHEEFR